MTHKPNRVHISGLVAEWSKETNMYFISLLKERAKYAFFLPKEIVEGPGWKEEKSEIDFLYNCINEHVRDWYNKNDDQEIKRMILEFAKNYKQQKS